MAANQHLQIALKNYENPPVRNIYVPKTVSQFTSNDFIKYRRELEKKKAQYNDQVNPQRHTLKICKNAIATSIPYVMQSPTDRAFFGLSLPGDDKYDLGLKPTLQPYIKRRRTELYDSVSRPVQSYDPNKRGSGFYDDIDKYINMVESSPQVSDGEQTDYSGEGLHTMQKNNLAATRQTFRKFIEEFMKKYPQKDGETSEEYEMRVIDTGINIFKSMPLNFWDVSEVSKKIDHVVGIKTKIETDPQKELYDLTNQIRDEKINVMNNEQDKQDERYIDIQAAKAASTPEFDREIVREQIKNKIDAKALASDIGMKQRLAKDNPAVYSGLLKDLLEADVIRRDKISAKQDNDIKTSIIANFPRVFTELKEKMILSNPSTSDMDVIKKIYAEPIENFIEVSKKYIKDQTPPPVPPIVEDPEKLSYSIIRTKDEILSLDALIDEITEKNKQINDQIEIANHEIEQAKKYISDNKIRKNEIVNDIDQNTYLPGAPQLVGYATELKDMELKEIEARYALENANKDLQNLKGQLSKNISGLTEAQKSKIALTTKLSAESEKIKKQTPIIDISSIPELDFLRDPINNMIVNPLETAYNAFISSPDTKKLSDLVAKFGVLKEQRDPDLPSLINFEVPTDKVKIIEPGTKLYREKQYDNFIKSTYNNILTAIKNNSPYIPKNEYEKNKIFLEQLNKNKPDKKYLEEIKLNDEYNDFVTSIKKDSDKININQTAKRKQLKEEADKQASEQAKKQTEQTQQKNEEEEKLKQYIKDEETKIPERIRKEYPMTIPVPALPKGKVSEKKRQEEEFKKKLQEENEQGEGNYQSQFFNPASEYVQKNRDAIVDKYKEGYDVFVEDASTIENQGLYEEKERNNFVLYDKLDTMPSSVQDALRNNSTLFDGKTINEIIEEGGKQNSKRYATSKYGDKTIYLINTSKETSQNLENTHPNLFKHITIYNKDSQGNPIKTSQFHYVAITPQFFDDYIIGQSKPKSPQGTPQGSPQGSPQGLPQGPPKAQQEEPKSQIITESLPKVAETVQQHQNILIGKKEDMDAAIQAIKKMRLIKGFDENKTISKQPEEIFSTTKSKMPHTIYGQLSNEQKNLIKIFLDKGKSKDDNKKIKEEIIKLLDSGNGFQPKQTKKGRGLNEPQQINRAKGLAITHKRDLTQYGYKDVKTLSDKQRHDALDKALDGFYKKEGGKTSLMRKLNALAVVNKNRDPDLSELFKKDSQYVAAHQ